MLTIIFLIWLLGVCIKLAGFAIRAGWTILKILFTIVFLPLLVVGLLLGGIIQMTGPILMIILGMTILYYIVKG